MTTVTKHIRYSMNSYIKNIAESKQKIMLFSKKVILTLLLSGHTERIDCNIVGSSYCYSLGFFNNSDNYFCPFRTISTSETGTAVI